MESTIQSLAGSPSCPTAGGIPQPQYDVWVRACVSGLCSDWFSIFVHSPAAAKWRYPALVRSGFVVGNIVGYSTHVTLDM
ncbi:MAG: hypothetical protein ACKV22_41550 [Bryobacteraceae bacterium]